MNCPRCNQPTHVVASRPKDSVVRRQRQCGRVQHGKVVGASCGLKFWTVELPAGVRCNVAIKVGLEGIEAEVVKKR